MNITTETVEDIYISNNVMSNWIAKQIILCIVNLGLNKVLDFATSMLYDDVKLDDMLYGLISVAPYEPESGL
ncbi:hypothetical protein MIDIC_500012 [Alphaproteobacteria bacterium]